MLLGRVLMMLPTFYFLLVTLIDIKAVTGTPKKGLAIGSGFGYLCMDTNAFSDASWWYDWRADQAEHKRLHCKNKPHGEYIPMIKLESDVRTVVIPPEARYVLGFNEPNTATEANITAERAAQLWPEVEKKAAGRKLISPSVAGCSYAPYCIDWFEKFFAACKNCRVDALAVHSYSCNADYVMRQLKIVSEHFNKKLWLTEFACHTAKTADLQLEFLKKIQPMLESSPFIEKYSWFQPRFYWNSTFINNSVNLLKQHASTLTELGKYYNEYGQNHVVG